MEKTILEVEHLYKSFDMVSNKIDVLNNINLDIYEGDFTVIMGSSGSGKSTLLYSISSMDKPTKGSVKLLGNDITKYSENELAQLRAKDISFVFQGINLVPDLTVFENISYPAYLVEEKDVVNKKTEEILKSVGLWEQRNKYPNEISGGQQQRVAIARALVTNPKVMFADEPTGALNSKAGIEVLDLFTKYNEQNQTIVMVTHDIKACARGNRLLYLSDGQIKGDFDLGKYVPEQQEQREKKIFEFLKSNNW